MRARTLVAAFALTLLLPGCSFLKARPDPTRYFVLTSEEPKKPVVAASLVVGVDRIELPEYLMRPELVTRSASNQITIAEYDRWGEPLKEGFSRTLRRDLENDLGAGHVIAAPFDPANRPAVSVDVEVRRFERVGDEGAVLEGSWTIRDGKSATTLVTRDSHQHTPVSGDEPRATVAALSSSLAALAREIAAAARALP